MDVQDLAFSKDREVRVLLTVEAAGSVVSTSREDQGIRSDHHLPDLIFLFVVRSSGARLGCASVRHSVPDAWSGIA